MTFEENLINNIKGISLVIGIFILIFVIFPKIIIFFLKICTKIYEKFFMGDNVIKVSGHQGDLFNSNVLGKKVIVKDENGNIIHETSEGIDDDIFNKIAEQVMSGECVSEEFKRSHNNGENKSYFSKGTLKTFSGGVPNEILDSMKKYGSIKIVKDQYGNTLVKDINGNILEGEDKKQAIEAMRKISMYRGPSVSQINISNEDFEEMMRDKGIEVNSKLTIEDIEKLNEGSGVESKNLMVDNFLDVSDEYMVEDDDGITRY